MKHLSRKGRAYICIVVAFGAATIAQSIFKLYIDPLGWNWAVLAILTLVSGSATVTLPSVPATISISETFVITSVLLFGPAAGTVTVALDALVISLWLARRGHPAYRIAFNVFALPGALWVGAHLFYMIGDLTPLSRVTEAVNISRLLLPLFVFTLVYFLLNSWSIAIAISFEKAISPIVVWRDNFAWLSLNYFGGASVAALLVTYTRDIDYTYLAFVLPLLAILYFTFSVSMGRVADANKHLTQMNQLYMSTIETLAMAIDAKDQITHGHIRRVQHYAVALARRMGVTDTAQLSAIEAASLLHDMGKLAVPEYILNKPGRLTPAEFEKIKLHASVGADILSAIDFPYPVVPIVRHHHENWDGTGYPDGLAGSDIPIGARILSVVDCFDALTSDRPYRPRLSDQDAIAILLERRGTMYDPLVVDTFIRVVAEIAPESDARAVAAGMPHISRSAIRTAEEDAGTQTRLNHISASTEEMLVLYDLAQSLTAQLDISEAAELIALQLRRVVPASTAVFYVFEQERDDLFVAHASGDSASHFSGLRIPRGQRLTGWVAANRRTILNSDPVLDLGEIARSLRPPLKSCLSTAIVYRDQLVGVLTVYSTDSNAFTEDHKRILEVIGTQAAQTFHRALQLQRDTSARSGPDRAGHSTKQAERMFDTELALLEGASNLSILLLRVTPLPQGRDLQPIAAALERVVRSVLRDPDLLLTYGNRDFVVLLRQTGSASAQAIAQRIITRLAKAKADRTIPHDLQVSIGVATAPDEGDSFQSLLQSALRTRLPAVEHGSDPTSIH